MDVIGTALNEDFQINGDSDEAYRIEGGSSMLIKALVDALAKAKTEMKLNYALTELDYQGGQIVMGFDAPGGVQTRNFDAVILALPFTKLRQVKGLDRLNLSCEKLKCINELGMGKHAKIMVGTTSRVWGSPPRSAACLAPMAASFPRLGSRIFGRRAPVSRSGERPAFSPSS